MKGYVRRQLPMVVALLLAAVVGAIAIGDHRDKQSRMDRAELSEWYCRHLGQRCGGPSSVAIENHWNERQIGYEVVVGLLVGAAVLSVVLHRRPST